MTTKWTRHKERWSNCTLCPLGHTATKHVLLRGKLPCEVLFIGEAPGVDEDLTGKPFIGRSGKLLDEMIAEVQALVTSFTFAITNTLACIPRGVDTNFRPPAEHELSACSPRLHEVVRLANPYGIVFVGKVACDWGSRIGLVVRYDTHIPNRMIYHPSYILRKGGRAALEFKRQTIVLADFIESLQIPPF